LGKLYNSKEAMFGIEPYTDYSILQIMNKEFQPYYNLWSIADKWQENKR